MIVVVRPSGHVQCLYAEGIDLSVLGVLRITRASHVEPDTEGKWWADLTPVGGPTQGPFALRSEALDFERRWLEAHWLVRADPAPSSLLTPLG
jgi:hypothetical protein